MMTTIDEYLAAVRRFAAELEARGDGAFELFISSLKGRSKEAETCVAFRLAIATEAELSAVTGYLEIGFFADADETCRRAWWLFLFDIIDASDNLLLEAVFAPYSRDQPLFQGAPKLFDHIRRKQRDGEAGEPDHELIDETVVCSFQDSEVFALNPGFAKLVPQLRPQIPAWASSQFPAAPRYLRLDPRSWYAEQPMMRLEEAAIVPADPSWMETLALFPGMKTFASYVLEDCDPKVDRAQCRDYRLRNIRRLEITAQRRGADYLTMMLEELPRADDRNGLMVGRCIHLDTSAQVGTPMAEVRLQHLDLAINVYRGDRRHERMADSLQNGKVCDASYRTHLYRIEDIPFPALFAFAGMYFKSGVLLGEWVADLGLNKVQSPHRPPSN
jgi:hypothetical protein